MRRIRSILIAIVAVAAIDFLPLDSAFAADAPTNPPGTSRAAPPADRVVTLYFHRTIRCPTCRKMGSYTEEAVKKGFPKFIKERKVEFHFIDFQDQKNEKLTKNYKIQGPTLIVIKVRGNKVKEFKNLKEMWVKVGDKEAFLKYVQENVAAYLPQRKRETTAAK